MSLKFKKEVINLPKEGGIQQWVVDQCPNGTFYIPIHFTKYIAGNAVDYAFSRFFAGCKEPEDYCNAIIKLLETMPALQTTAKKLIDEYVNYHMVIHCYASINPWKPEKAHSIIFENKIIVMFV